MFPVEVFHHGVGGIPRGPDRPPAIVIDEMVWYDYRPVDFVESYNVMLDMRNKRPEIFHYLEEQKYEYEPRLELTFITEFDQWQVVTFFDFKIPGEGIIFAMWFAEQLEAWKPRFR